MSKTIYKFYKRGEYLAFAGLMLTNPGIGLAEYGLNFPEMVTPLGKQINSLHNLTSAIMTAIMILLVAVVSYSIYTHRLSRGFKADQEMHKGGIAKWSWLIVTSIVIVIDIAIAVPASNTLTAIETYEPGDITLKITGSQWKWTYEYINDGVEDGLDDNIKFTALLTPEKEAKENYLRATDKSVVLPTGMRIRLLQTASDVIHSWWVPALGLKKDSIPGYINETWAIIEKPGIYRGQCAEICGKGHAYMPIVVEAVSPDDYKKWVRETKLALASVGSFEKTGWTKAKLMKTGQKVFNSNCAACHMENGEGVPGLFPALKSNVIATKSDARSSHITTVLNGRNGTAMPAWGPQLNDLEIASVVTYERNAWGNNSGDLIQPVDVEQLRVNKVAAK